MSMHALLVAIDNPLQQQCLRVLRDAGWEVTVVDSTARALGLLVTEKFDALLADLRLARFGATDLPVAAQRANPAIKVVLMVEPTGAATQPEPLRLRGFPLLTKPLKPENLADLGGLSTMAAVGPGTPPVAPPVPSSAAPMDIAGLVGQSERMQKIQRLIAKVAPQRHPVLIMGESGTGKEVVARAIHTHSPWRDRPFVPVDCGALPPTLIESELFGHVKGAFTGAAASRQGLLAAAGSGTVFLDEIGELPLELQSRLLRTLQEHEVRPLGGNQRIRFEARIVAATNQDLEAGVKRGTFRKDLFFRLNVVAIKMPALRDRKTDIPQLVRHFLASLCRDKAIPQLSDQALMCLMNYDWPGNVRELENCIQRAVSLGSGTFIELKDLPSAMLYRLSRPSSSAVQPLSLQALEQQAIRNALRAAEGDRVRAAKLLGIGKTTIYRKLKEYGIDETSPAG